MQDTEIDRSELCPFLLRLLWKENESHELEELSEEPDPEREHEIHLYTWLNASLREILNSVKTSLPMANRKNCSVIFFHVYQDTSGRFKKKSIATLHSVKHSKIDDITLTKIRFEIGDILEISIQTTPPVGGRPSIRGRNHSSRLRGQMDRSKDRDRERSRDRDRGFRNGSRGAGGRGGYYRGGMRRGGGMGGGRHFRGHRYR